MTDSKKVIINGVDVGGRGIIKKFDGTLDEYNVCLDGLDKCKLHPNCYYKQLKAKEQECERYKKLATDFKDVNKQMGYKYLTIKQECEELKNKLNDKGFITIDEKTFDLTVENMGKLLNYKLALEKIEEHFEHRCNICCDNYGLGADCAVCWHKDILDIINEVKNEYK